LSPLADASSPKTIAWDAADAALLGFESYAIRLDGERTDLGVLPLSTCADTGLANCHRVELPPLPSGPHTVEVSAYNAAGETSAAPISIDAGQQTVHLRLWTKLGGTWWYTDTAIVPSSLTAQFAYPIGNAVRVDLTRPISWTEVPGAEAYSLVVGRAGGGPELVNAPDLHQTSYLAASLPAYETLVARLGTRVAGVWRYRSLSFVALPSAASLISPADGGTAPDAAVILWWLPIP